LARDDFIVFDPLRTHRVGKYNIDRNRIDLTRLSNAADFAHLLASQKGDVVGAIACHSGGIGLFARCQPVIKHRDGVIEDSIATAEEDRKA
jgi:poly(3-hydroxybutyrate) depolymerase